MKAFYGNGVIMYKSFHLLNLEIDISQIKFVWVKLRMVVVYVIEYLSAIHHCKC